MITFIFTTLYFGFISLASWFLYRYRRFLFRSFLGAYIISFVALNYIGLLILFFQLDDYRFDIGVNNPELITWMLIYSIIAFTCVSVTYLSLYKVKNFKTASPVRASPEENLLVISILLLTVFSVMQIMSRSGSVALIVALSSSAEVNEIMLARSDMGNNNSNNHWIRIATNQMPMIIFYYFYLKQVGSSAVFRVSLFAGFIAVCVVLTLSTAKFAIIQFLLGIVFLQWKYIRPLSVRKILVRGAAVFSMIILMYMTFAAVSDVQVAMRIALSRMLTGSIAPAHFYLEFFPQVESYLHGRSLPNPMGIFPWQPYNLTTEVMYWKFPRFADLGIVGSSPTTFWGEGYANLGTAGVILASVYLGTFIATSQHVFDRYNRFLFIRAVEGWVFCYIFAANISGISEYMKVTIIIPLIALLILPRLRLRKT